ncbi:MAG: hypothetical protein HZA50_13690 [Planctomycetes bacterium]|nr:hypothetical protein [Planctomycetota bacterium]
MKKWVKYTIWGIGGTIGVAVILIGIFLYLLLTQNDRMNRDPAAKTEMIETTLEWARLAPFPQKAANFNIYTEGSAFTRTFKGSFTATEEIIKTWVEQSPGLQDAKIESISVKKKKYIISPGGGANYAEVIIDYETGKVEFKAYWS